MDTITELDLLDPASFVRGPPHDYFDHLRRNDPCHELRAPYGDRFWALTRAADIRAVSMDTERFTSSLGFLYPAALASSLRAAALRPWRTGCRHGPTSACRPHRVQCR